MKYTSSLILTAAFSLCAIAGAHATAVGDQTFTGKVSLTKASISNGSTGAVAGAKLANLSISGTIQEQATVSKIVDVAPPNTAEGFLATLATAQRVSNSVILDELVDLGLLSSKKGYSLRVVLLHKKSPYIQAYKKGQPPVAVPTSLLDLYFGWAEDFDGIFKTIGSGSASATVSETASGTTVLLSSGKLSGFNPVEGVLFNDIGFNGVGSFSETTKGYSGSANVAGDNFGPL